MVEEKSKSDCIACRLLHEKWWNGRSFVTEIWIGDLTQWIGMRRGIGTDQVLALNVMGNLDLYK